MDRYEEQEEAESLLSAIEMDADLLDVHEIAEVMEDASNFDDDYTAWLVEFATLESDGARDALDSYIRRAKIIKAFQDDPVMSIHYNDLDQLEVCAGRDAV